MTTTIPFAESTMARILNWIVPPKPGQTEGCPLDLACVPGLTTLLDVALFHSNEGQLTGTIVTSHALLCTWLDVKHQSQIVLQLLKNCHPPSLNNSMENVESFARQSLESSMDAIERMSTERLASSANLSDPYESIATGSTSGGGGHHTHHHHSHHHHHSNHSGQSSMLTGIGVSSISEGISESKIETGRRQPMQRRKDCWESSRLQCPDYIWADDVYQACQRWIKNLDKHPVMDASRSQTGSGLFDFTTFASPANQSGGGGSHKKGSNISHHTGEEYVNDGTAFDAEIGRQTRILVQLIEDDLPMRLYQFKQACETDAVVTKRLYLVKCEYRAPLRAFWEAHQSLLRAPPIELVDHYLEDSEWTLVQKGNQGKGNEKMNKQASDSNNKKKGGTQNLQASPGAIESQGELKNNLQSLLQKPELIEMLTLEMEAEKIEVELGQALYPFAELARNIDQKKARLRTDSGIVDIDDRSAIQETIRRLKFIMCRKSSYESSTGIRPILLDLQMIRRDDEPTESTALGWHTPPVTVVSPFMTLPKDSSIGERIDVFLEHLSILSKLVQTKNAFSIPGYGDVDFSSQIVRGCTGEYDPELLRCQLIDWFALVDWQHELQKESTYDGDDNAEKIRLAELKISVAGANKASLQMVKERLVGIQDDRANRLVICKEMIEEVCLREMNLYVTLYGPESDRPLELKQTSAKGFLGIPLCEAGEPLPV